jgi:DNA-directed RNA polymerase subunit E'/Rpb7
MSTLFLPVRFKAFVQLAPYELGSDYDMIILEKLRKTYEGVCTRFGYLRPKSVEVVQRSMGQFMKQHFNGFIRFEVKCKGEVCNPAKGAVVEAIVRKKNELGIHAESLYDGTPILDIIIPKRAAGIISEVDLDKFQVNDVMHVEIVGKRYQLHDRTISIIGRGVQEPSADPVKQDIIEDVSDNEKECEDDDDIDCVVGDSSEDEEEMLKKVVKVEEDEVQEEGSEVGGSDEDYFSEGGEDDEEEVESEGGAGFDDDF